MKTITFYAYKGGTGRSLVVANVAKYLARFGSKVFVIDLDLEAPGLHYKFSNTDSPLPIKKGAVDYFSDFQNQAELPKSVADYCVSVPLGKDVPGIIDLMPAGAAPSSDYWRKLAKLNWHDFFYSPAATGVALFLEMKERIRHEYQPDFLLIDARTGITEVGGVATTVLPDVVVCLLANNRENLDGIRVVLRSIQRSVRAHAAQIDIIPVLTRIPKQDEPNEEATICNEISNYLNEQAEALEDTLNLEKIYILHSDPPLQMRERVLVGSQDSVETSALLKDYLSLFVRLIPRDLLLPYVTKLLENAKASLFDDPDATEMEFENLAKFFAHPDIYRVLLQIYRIRKADVSKMISVIAKLFELTGDSEDEVSWSIIKSQSKNIQIDTITIEACRVIENYWKHHTPLDCVIGHKIAEMYAFNDLFDDASNVLVCLRSNGRGSVETVATMLEYMRKAKAWKNVIELLKSLEPCEITEEVLIAWSQALIDNPKLNESVPIGTDVIRRLSRKKATKAGQLLSTRKKNDPTSAVLSDVFPKVFGDASSETVSVLSALFFLHPVIAILISEGFKKLVQPADGVQQSHANIDRPESLRPQNDDTVN